jgi:hypothetical protein
MLTFTFTYMYLSSAYNSFVSGFAGNTNIHQITQVKTECKLSHSLFKIVSNQFLISLLVLVNLYWPKSTYM